jgi:uroporphyrin-III C-methyltransferase
MSVRKLMYLFLVANFFMPIGTTFGMSSPVSPGKLFLVSTGPGDPKYLTQQAIDTMQKADIVLANTETAKRMDKFVAGKTVEDPWKELWTYQGKIWMKDLETFAPEERAAIVAAKSRQRDQYVVNLKKILAQGKNIVVLDGGDPTVYSRGFWLLEGLDESQFEIVPGVGAMTASMAALKRTSSGGGARYIMQTAPYSFLGKEDPDDLARALSRYPGTLVFYMGLTKLGDLVTTLKKYNQPDLPIAVVFHAGYPEKERTVKGSLNDIMEKLSGEQEKWMGMIIVGKSLTGPPFALLEQ